MQTISDVLSRLPSPQSERLPAPAYAGNGQGRRVGLAVESMKRHTSDEGWVLFSGLQHAGYALHGLDIGPSLTDVPAILDRERPSVVLMQDRREWEGLTADRSRDPRMRFRHVEVLRERPDVLKLTVIKDAQHDPAYHRQAADEIGAHGWVVYYAPRIVCHLAPYLRPEHLVRTWHTVDASIVPPYSPEGRGGCLLSGAVSHAYPLRRRVMHNARQLPGVTVLPHPGYHRRGCATPEFLRTLSRFKVAVCTSSVYGYALRKLIEATACGCAVLTDLPADEEMPFIDSNLHRVRPDASMGDLAAALRCLLDIYDPARQEHYARLAKEWYDFRAAGVRLAADIEALRKGYTCSTS